ncbi:MAG: prepilin-type N-terminal cleavage/methylation domain-containing protein [Roseovarius sp.]|jgi:type IV pilus assembly protein PilV|nr:prepilin-type N-terminal cleavage/methylation domain-containing protein [Roseovarius sp.]
MDALSHASTPAFTMSYSISLERQSGSSLIEILVTILILAVGFLGLAGFMVQQQNQDIDSYQRAQALLLLNDMSQRMQSNRANADDYITGTENPLGIGMACETTAASIAEQDLNAWCSALQGSAESLGTQSVGAMVGARGCVEARGPQQYAITVAWQGMTPVSVPAATCGAGEYNGAVGSPCVEDRCRRTVTTLVRIGSLAP